MIRIATLIFYSYISTGALSNLCINQLVRNANEEQKNKYLPQLVAGDVIGGLAMSESDAGSDVMSMRTTAVRKGDYYVINGSKFWITNGPIAEFLILYAKTDPTRSDGKSVTAFIIDTRTEGFTANHIHGKLGMRGSPTGDLHFDNMKVPATSVLRGEGQGAAVLMSGLNIERILAAAVPIGIAQAALDCAIPYAHDRKQFGKRIGEFQLLQGKMADMYTTLSACRSYLYNVARHAELHEPTNHECAGLVLYCAEKSTQICLDAIQILGGNGYSKYTSVVFCASFFSVNDYPVGRYLRDAKLWEIGAGTSEVRRLIIGRYFNQMYRNN